MATQSREERKPSTPDGRFADALRPLVESALKRSARDEPQFWAQTIFPILAPAIRMAVASAIRDMVQTLNQLLETACQREAGGGVWKPGVLASRL